MNAQHLNQMIGSPAWAGLVSSAKLALVLQAAIASGVQGGSTMTTGTESGLFDEVVGGVYWDTANELPLEFQSLFSVETTGKGRERRTSYNELDELEEVGETEAAPEDTLSEEFPKDFVPAEYKKKVPVSRKLRDDLEWPLIAQIPAALARAGMRTYDNKGAAVLNDAFTGVTYKTADNLSICNSAHLNRAGGNSQDNSHTESLGREGLRLTRQRFRDVTDAKGNLMSLDLTAIAIPNELEQTGLELSLSNEAPHTTDRETNIYRGLDVYVLSKLTSAVNWFGFNMPTWMLNAILMSRISPELVTFNNADTGVAWISLYLRFALGVVDWRGIMGNAP